MTFVLASASPRRLELLAQIGREPIRVLAADIDETPLKDESPRHYVARMAREKALAIDVDGLILAADTSVVLGRRILGKPEDEKDARWMLERLSGRRHVVLSAVALRKGETLREKIVETKLRFRRLERREIDEYLASGEWQGKAGGYAIQGRAAAFIPWISGSYSNVVGLPLAETAVMLESFDV